MSEVTYTIPTVGEKVSVAVPKVNTALTELKTVINGKIEAVNVKEETLTGKSMGSETLRMLATSKYSALVGRAEGEYEPSATRATYVVLNIVHSATEITITEIQVGGVLIGTFATNEKAGAQSPQFTLGFIVPAAVKWKWIKGSGTPEVKSSYLTL